jgi:hypothetical protein
MFYFMLLTWIDDTEINDYTHGFYLDVKYDIDWNYEYLHSLLEG